MLLDMWSRSWCNWGIVRVEGRWLWLCALVPLELWRSRAIATVPGLLLSIYRISIRLMQWLSFIIESSVLWLNSFRVAWGLVSLLVVSSLARLGD